MRLPERATERGVRARRHPYAGPARMTARAHAGASPAAQHVDRRVRVALAHGLLLSETHRRVVVPSIHRAARLSNPLTRRVLRDVSSAHRSRDDARNSREVARGHDIGESGGREQRARVRPGRTRARRRACRPARDARARRRRSPAARRGHRRRASSAERGSKRTSPSRRCGSCRATYGGFEAMRSKRAVGMPSYQSDRSQPTLASPSRCAFARATASASSECPSRESRARGRSCASASAIAPLPVPRSSTATSRSTGSRESASRPASRFPVAGSAPRATRRAASPEFAHAGQVGDRLAVAAAPARARRMRRRHSRRQHDRPRAPRATRGRVRARGRAAPARRAERGRSTASARRTVGASVTGADWTPRTARRRAP